MKRFRINIALLLVCLIICTATATFLFASGWWPQGCLMLIASAACIAMIIHLQSRLIGTMSAFVKALEMNDTTMRVEISGDSELKKMSDAMNRISNIYSENMRALQTSKLYYDRVLKIMTHEMRNGITPIVAISADMSNHPERYKEDKFSEAAQLINSQAEGVHRFLNAYYTLTHIPEPKIEIIKAGNYIKQVKRLYKAELDRRGFPEALLSFTIAEDMPLNIDITLMNQVMINLFRNSLDAISKNSEGKVEVIFTISDSRPCIIVKDNGNGLTTEAKENLFQPFFTTKKEGHGVGLTISRQIVMRHGGDIRIQSLPTKGTSVIVTI